MGEEKLIQEYKKEQCSKCNKNIDCKIVVRGDKAYCTEEEE